MINMGEHSEKAAVSFFSAPQIVQCNISISGVDRILYVKLIESELLNIDRHMIRNQEFLFDERNGELQVLLDLPLVYLLHGSVAFSIEILVMNSEDSYTKFLKKSITFNWKPLKKQRDGQVGFAYADPLTDKKYDRKIEIKNQIRKELTNTNIDRFEMKYKNAIFGFMK